MRWQPTPGGPVIPLWQNQATAADALKRGKANPDQIVAQAYQEYQSTM